MAHCVIIDGSLRRPHHVAVNVCLYTESQCPAQGCLDTSRAT